MRLGNRESHHQILLQRMTRRNQIEFDPKLHCRARPQRYQRFSRTHDSAPSTCWGRDERPRSRGTSGWETIAHRIFECSRAPIGSSNCIEAGRRTSKKGIQWPRPGCPRNDFSRRFVATNQQTGGNILPLSCQTPRSPSIRSSGGTKRVDQGHAIVVTRRR